MGIQGTPIHGPPVQVWLLPCQEEGHLETGRGPALPEGLGEVVRREYAGDGSRREAEAADVGGRELREDRDDDLKRQAPERVSPVGNLAMATADAGSFCRLQSIGRLGQGSNDLSCQVHARISSSIKAEAFRNWAAAHEVEEQRREIFCVGLYVRRAARPKSRDKHLPARIVDENVRHVGASGGDVIGVHMLVLVVAVGYARVEAGVEIVPAYHAYPGEQGAGMIREAADLAGGGRPTC